MPGVTQRNTVDRGSLIVDWVAGTADIRPERSSQQNIMEKVADIRRGCDVPCTEHRIPLRLGIARSRLEGYGIYDIILAVPEERIVSQLMANVRASCRDRECQSW